MTFRRKFSHSRATAPSREVLSSGDVGDSRFRHYVTEGFGVGRVGERREEENGRRGYGKRAGTSCEVRVARHEIASLAIEPREKGPSKLRRGGPDDVARLAVARPAVRAAQTRQDSKPVVVRRHLSSIARRCSDSDSDSVLKKRSRAEFSRPGRARRRGKHSISLLSASACLLSLSILLRSRVAKRRRRDRVAASRRAIAVREILRVRRRLIDQQVGGFSRSRSRSRALVRATCGRRPAVVV